MSTVIYFARASAAPAGGYNAVFPDLPDCHVSAQDLADLQAKARDAVRARLQRLADDGEDWPQATPVEQLQAEPGSFLLLVDVQVEDAPVRVNISMGEQLLKRLDAAAEARGTTRSGFIAQAVRTSLGDKAAGEAFAAREFDAAARRLQEEVSTLGRKISEALGPNSAFSRSLAEVDGRVTETVRKAADSVSAAMTRRKETEARPASSGERSEEPAGTGPI